MDRDVGYAAFGGGESGQEEGRRNRRGTIGLPRPTVEWYAGGAGALSGP